jgi:hypothetical protein
MLPNFVFSVLSQDSSIRFFSSTDSKTTWAKYYFSENIGIFHGVPGRRGAQLGNHCSKERKKKKNEV